MLIFDNGFSSNTQPAPLCTMAPYRHNERSHDNVDPDFNGVPFKALHLAFVGTNGLRERHVGGDPLWHLLRLGKETHVDFEQIEFTFAECKIIEEILLSKLEWDFLSCDHGQLQVST